MADKRTKKLEKAGESSAPRVGWELTERVLASRVLARIYLWGKPGVGKTWAAYHKGRIGRGVYAITLTPEMPASELRGHYLPRGNELVWHDGPVVRALREGARLVINEPAHASDDVIAFLYPILEMPETARLTLPTGETVTPAPGFHVVLTDNCPPDDLPPALRDRLDATIEVGEPHPEALAALSEPLREVARRSFVLDEERRLSLRPLLTIDLLRHELGLADACLVVLGAERGSQVLDAIQLAGGC
jgi:nitric oxide reductase NorQ protein